MKIKDYFYSGETFEIKEVFPGVMKTENIPSDISSYYNSDNYISHTNSKKSLFEKTFSQIQKWNFNYKFRIINKYKKSGKILDFGCGNGEFLAYLKHKNYSCYGYEPLYRKESVDITIYHTLDAITSGFDVITLWHVLEHIENPEEIIAFLKTKLNADGVLIIALPNYTSFDAKYYQKEWAAWDVPRHIYHYSKNGALRFFTQQTHTYIEKLYALPFDSFYISLISAGYKNSIIQKVISPFIAVISNFMALFNNQWSSLIYVLKKEIN